MRHHSRKQLVIRPFLLALALTLAATLLTAAAQAQAIATQQIAISIPYALLLHVDAHQSTTTKLQEGVIVTAEVNVPLSLYLHTNDAWRLTITTQSGTTRTLAGAHGVHEITETNLGLTVRDGERVTFTVERQ